MKEKLSWKEYRNLVYDINRLKITGKYKKDSENGNNNKDVIANTTKEQMVIEKDEELNELQKEYEEGINEIESLNKQMKEESQKMEREINQEKEKERNEYQKQVLR